jgi:predicted SnoaL-like aldol condensation-catalyzing enzyme
MPATPGAVIREWFEQLWNQGKEETIDRLLAPGAIAHGLGPQPIVGPEGFKPFFRQLRTAFPDFHVEIVQMVEQGDMVAVVCHVTGVHDGPGMGAPSNANVDFWGMTMGRVRNGQLVEGWNSYDFMTCYQQMGILGSPSL